MRRLLDQEKLELAKYVRQAKGSLSLNAFSQKTGVSKYQLSRIMNGKFKDQPRESTILAIANGSERSSIREILKIAYLSEETYNQEIDVYYGKNVPLFRRNGYRKPGAMIP